MDRIENTASNIFSVVVCLYDAKETYLLSRFIATEVSSGSNFLAFLAVILYIFM
jgi:hypothetical protein